MVSKLVVFVDTFLKKREMHTNCDFSTSCKRDAHFQGSRPPKSEQILILGPPQNRSHFKATLLKDLGSFWKPFWLYFFDKFVTKNDVQFLCVFVSLGGTLGTPRLREYGGGVTGLTESVLGRLKLHSVSSALFRTPQ